MKKARVLGFTTGLILLLAGVSFAAQGEQTFKGTVACVKMGAKYVLYDSSDKAVYKLSDQKKPEGFAGAKEVEVMGTLDKATKTIKVSDIKAAS